MNGRVIIYVSFSFSQNKTRIAMVTEYDKYNTEKKWIEFNNKSFNIKKSIDAGYLAIFYAYYDIIIKKGIKNYSILTSVQSIKIDNIKVNWVPKETNKSYEILEYQEWFYESDRLEKEEINIMKYIFKTLKLNNKERRNNERKK